MLASFDRSVGFAEGVVMSFDPDVLLPNAFAATVPGLICLTRGARSRRFLVPARAGAAVRR